MFKFYFDDIEVSNPTDWDNFTESIVRDNTIKAILPKYENTLTFTGDAYKYLFDKYYQYGFCKIIEFKVEQYCSSTNPSPLFKGTIFVSDCIFNLNECTVECDITDNSFGAKIFNNKSIKTALSGGKSKNGVDITPATSTPIFFFDCSTSDPDYTRGVYTYFETLKYLVSFVSDGTLGFESDYLTTIKRGGFITGKELRTDVGDVPVVSFQQVFAEIDKKYPLGLTVVDRNGTPTLKIEEAEYFYSSDTSIQIDNIKDLKLAFTNELLYSGVRFGSETVLYDAAIHHFIPKQFIGFQDEEYFLSGVCNIDKVLDLYSDFIIDSNIFEELLTTNTTNESWDTNILMVDIYVGADYAVQTPMPPSYNTWYYNDDFTSSKIAERNQFAGDTTLYTGLNTSGFRSERTNYVESPRSATNGHDNADFYQGCLFGINHPELQTSAWLTTVFNNDSTGNNYNLGGNYNNSNGRYTIPTTGYYAFSNYTKIGIFHYLTGDACSPVSNIFGGINRYTRINVKFSRFNSGGTLLEDEVFTYPDSLGIGIYDGGVDGFFYAYNGGAKYGWVSNKYFICSATDYVTCAVQLETIAVNPLFGSAIYVNVTNDSYFTTTATTSGGGVVETGNADGYRTSKLMFKNPTSKVDWDTLKLDLSKAIVVNHDGSTNRTGWIRQATHNFSTKQTDWELISNINNSR